MFGLGVHQVDRLLDAGDFANLLLDAGDFANLLLDSGYLFDLLLDGGYLFDLLLDGGYFTDFDLQRRQLVQVSLQLGCQLRAIYEAIHLVQDLLRVDLGAGLHGVPARFAVSVDRPDEIEIGGIDRKAGVLDEHALARLEGVALYRGLPQRHTRPPEFTGEGVYCRELRCQHYAVAAGIDQDGHRCRRGPELHSSTRRQACARVANGEGVLDVGPRAQAPLGGPQSEPDRSGVARQDVRFHLETGDHGVAHDDRIGLPSSPHKGIHLKGVAGAGLGRNTAAVPRQDD